FGTKYAPKYIGSDKYDIAAAPYLGWSNGSLYINSEKGFGYTHQFDNGAYVGQALGYSLGRADNNNSWLKEGSDKLKGMGTIKTAMTSTTTAGWWLTPWMGVEGNVIAPITDSQGMQYNLKANFLVVNNETDTLTLSTTAWYGDARFNNTWFGVNEKQSLHSSFQKYNAKKGFNRLDYSITWQHGFSKNWSGYAEASYTMLENRVNNSPLVDANNSFQLATGVFYSF
ncbi:MipA/OmpV family protein, partial [Citrobacter freundii]|uniref:MipA/OmpV family protein n=6 Tax=Enterobacterales TaxID=91347 RepID=UPI00294746D8|nr:MipA/OmpV family protein [Citrobacter freundii]HED3084862.1 MipA/OmpV family protein [Citrobacter freundii]HED3535674.1 MipA/OmpV family protein [Citrobacter freundii]